jgi:vacuolar-type H+-ATPase subunit I/STV1
VRVEVENGYRTMEECESEDEEEETEKIGNKFRVNLNNMHSPNSKAISFLYRMQEFGRKKERALSMVKEELKKSTERIMKLHPDENKVTRYHVPRKGSQDPKTQISQEYRPK